MEEELKMSHEQLNLQAQNFTRFGAPADDKKVMNYKLVNEIELLKSGSSHGSRSYGDGSNSEQLRKERNDLQEENRRLISMVC